jgi:hypothetical protein
MRIGLSIAVAATLMAAGCVTAEQNETKAAAAQQRLSAVKAESTGEKVSLNKSLEEHGTMTLLDDETGEEKLVCKYIATTGTRFGRKICATPKEWEQKRKDSQEEVEKTQRNMDARCPGGNC